MQYLSNIWEAIEVAQINGLRVYIFLIKLKTFHYPHQLDQGKEVGLKLNFIPEFQRARDTKYYKMFW